MTDKTTRRSFLGRVTGATAGALAALGLGGARGGTVATHPLVN